ncbi:MAG: choline dehydrogenase [Gammaproteobacteria bacterium]|jgi:choline dehydrogenase
MSTESNAIDHYDYIIVGAGSAGCVLANRLSAHANDKVLLLEAGGETHPLSRVPISYGYFINKPGVNWRYFCEPEAATAQRSILVPRGRMVGGSSAINGLVFVRGQPLDYNTWAQLGNRGWSYDDVLPLFKRMETYEGRFAEDRGDCGPLRVSDSDDESPLYDALINAGEECGLPKDRDYNGPEQESIAKTQTTISNGRRMSVAQCYLAPVRSRRNLRVRTNALTQRLLFEGKRCIGVEFKIGERTIVAHARKEVVLSAGAINSPQLLELSGIGQREIIAAHGIEVRHELPGVGENLRDHLAPRLVNLINGKGVTYNDRMQGLGRAFQAFRYLYDRRGFMSIPSAPLLAFARTRPELEAPDLQIHFVPFAVENVQTRSLMKAPGMTCTFYQLRPESKGSIHIASADPNRHPEIRFNFLSDSLDRQTLIDGTHVARRILNSPAMAKYKGEELKPGKQVQSDDEILDWIRGAAETAFHPTCTCKMGDDQMAVVDAQLKVHGIDGLRVADGSIMPTLVSGNTNAACIMIGEKASDMILAAHA